MRKKIGLLTMAMFLLSPLIGILLFNIYSKFFDANLWMMQMLSTSTIIVCVLSSVVFYLSFSPKEK